MARATLVYLAGAIEYAPDFGRAWRRDITPFLRDELGHRVYDPAEDERKSLTEEEQRNLRSWKTTDFDRFQTAIRKIIEWDIGILSCAEYVVCFWDQHAPKGGGTPSELTLAYRLGIPVYLVTPLDRLEISGWILACCRKTFANFDELKDFLRTQYM